MNKLTSHLFKIYESVTGNSHNIYPPEQPPIAPNKPITTEEIIKYLKQAKYPRQIAPSRQQSTASFGMKIDTCDAHGILLKP